MIPVVVDDYLVSLTSQWVTAGRMTWAFARDVRHTECNVLRMVLTPKKRAVSHSQISSHK